MESETFVAGYISLAHNLVEDVSELYIAMEK